MSVHKKVSLQAQAASLREAIRHGHTNIKDRLAIQLDFTNDKDDMRNGVITIDTIMYKARVNHLLCHLFFLVHEFIVLLPTLTACEFLKHEICVCTNK